MRMFGLQSPCEKECGEGMMNLLEVGQPAEVPKLEIITAGLALEKLDNFDRIGKICGIEILTSDTETKGVALSKRASHDPCWHDERGHKF